MHRLRLSRASRLAPVGGLAVLVAAAACFPGSHPPNVSAQRTLELSAGALGGAAPKAAFAVVFAGPKGDTVDPSEVTVVFNRPMRPLELAGDESQPPAKLIAREAPAPGGTWRWLGTSALAFVPAKALPRATEYEVTVPGATKALDGSSLGKDYVFSFRTPGPRLVAMTPSNGTSHVKPGQAFELRFNQPVDLAEVRRATRLTAGTKPVATLPFTISRPKPDVPMLVKLTPQRPLPLDSEIGVVVDASLRGLEGPLSAGDEHRMSVQTYGPLSVELSCSKNDKHKCAAHGGVWVNLSNRALYKDLRAHVRVDPPLALKWPKGRDAEDTGGISVPLDLPPAATVRVTVTAGLRDEYGQTLARDATVTFETDDELPEVSIGLQGDVFEAAKAKGRDVPVASINVPEYKLVTATPDEAGVMTVRAARRGRAVADMFDAAASLPGAKVEQVRPAAAKNTTALRNVSLDAALAKGKGRGAFVIGTLRPAKRYPDASLQMVSVTDLAISAKVSRFGSVVLVTRLSDGKPAAGATVAVRDASGKELLALPTDASGFAVLPADRFQPVTEDGSLDDALVIFARAGNDWTWRDVVDTVSRADMPYVDLAARMAPFGMLFTDRGIYKPGETIRVKGVFRRQNPKGLETVRGSDVTIKAYDPEGGTLFEETKKLGAFGEVSVDIAIPQTSRLGHVAIQASIDGEKKVASWESNAASTGVEVAAYRPAEFKVSAEPDRPAYVRGDKAHFVVRGDYLFGAPMSGGRVRYTATRSRTSFAPPGFEEGFSVDDDAYASALPDASPRGGKVQSGDGAIDAKGAYAADLALAFAKQQGPESVMFEAEVEDLSRQTIASQTTALVHPGEFYVALKRPKEYFLAEGTTLKVEMAAVEPSGKKRPGVPVEVEVVERTWQTSTEATGEWGVHYESRPVDKVVGGCRATTGADLGSCDVKVGTAGYFLVRAKAIDARKNPLASSFAVYVTGEGTVSWPAYDGPHLELVANKKSYQVGDQAQILVKSPFQEAEALVTVERQGIHEKRRVTLRGSMPTITVPITPEMWPNTFVAVELMRGRTAPPTAKGQDVAGPSYRIGWAEIAVDPESRRLAVAVRPSKKELRPGEEIDVDLAVTDRAGKAARADVAFYAVDEGVLMLTGYKTPDPLPVFAARRMLSVAPIESRDALARIVRLGRGPGEDKGDQGGGGGEGMSVREDFRTTAFFQPSVVTGPDGKARVHFKLPDGLTTYRLMAVATAEDDRFGFGQDQVVTSRPLMARPALPRFLRAGDAIEAGVILTSKGLGPETVEVKLDAKGVVVTGDATKTVALPANGSVEVRWTIGAPSVGPASFTFTAKGRSAGDIVKVDRDVAVPLSLEAVALYGDTETAIAEKLGDLRSIRPDVGGLDVRLSSTALVGLDDGVEALLAYPYGCTEQLTSRMVPLVALVDLARDYAIALPKDLDPVLDKAIAKILANQRGDGSFGYWPDSQRGDTWVSAYALWGLSLAKERGRPVPDDAIENATRWLRGQIEACGLKERRPSTGSFACDQDDVLLASQTFVVDVLAMTGHADAGYTSQLFERRDKMPLFARALLAHAMTLTKMRAEDAKDLVRDAENHLRVTGAGATIAENVGDRYATLLDSEARTTAIVLRTLVAVDPKHPLAARLAKGLLATRRGGAWRSTQENAWALLALDAYRKAQEATAPDFDAVAFAGDAELFRAPFHGRSVKAQGRGVPAAKLLASPGQTLAFQVDGKGRLFYEARLRYAKKELPETPLDRGFFVKKIVRSVRPEALSEALRVLPQTAATSAQASDLVLVDLLVVTPEPREQVVIDDPLPAGLEPVQAKLATTARDLSVTEPGDEGDAEDETAANPDERATGRAFETSWYHREFHDDRVLTFVDRMAAGMYHYRYLARATTLGRFVVPPTRAECMYEPETFGRTAATIFEVKK